MNTLREAVQDYLVVRRDLGFKLREAGKGLLCFVSFMEQHGATYITNALALDWAQQGCAGQLQAGARRLSSGYSTQTGHPFQRKLDTRSTPTWTVGAKRRAGWMLFTLGWVPPSIWVGFFAGIPRRG